MRAQCCHQILKSIIWQHVQEKIILTDFYDHFQEIQKIQIILTNAFFVYL